MRKVRSRSALETVLEPLSFFSYLKSVITHFFLMYGSSHAAISAVHVKPLVVIQVFRLAVSVAETVVISVPLTFCWASTSTGGASSAAVGRPKLPFSIGGGR